MASNNLFLVGAGIAMLIWFGGGILLGFRMGVSLAVRAELMREMDTGLNPLQTEFVSDIKRRVGAALEKDDYREWLRKYKLHDDAETRTLYKNKEYREALEKQ